MTGVKCRYYSIVYETIRRMAENNLACKVQKEKASRTVSCNTPYNIKHFLVSQKVEAMLKLTEEANHESPHLAKFDRRYLVENDKNTEMLDVKHILPIRELSIGERIIST